MITILRYYSCLFLALLFLSCRNNAVQHADMLFWCSNNNQEIKLCSAITGNWNAKHAATPVHMQPIPEGQSSEEVILAAVVGKSTPDIYANMWQGNVEMYAHAGVLIPLDTIQGFIDFIKERCDSNVIREITSSDGHIYQVPWKVNPIMTIYNKNAFRENGINQLPLTYSAYINAAALYKNHNINTDKRFGYTAVKAIWYERLFNY
jgi:multiple sugar transport system substrate-binding protein